MESWRKERPGNPQRPLVSSSRKPEAGVEGCGFLGMRGGSVNPRKGSGAEQVLGLPWRILQRDDGLNVLLSIPDSAKVVAFEA